MAETVELWAANSDEKKERKTVGEMVDSMVALTAAPRAGWKVLSSAVTSAVRTGSSLVDH